MSKAQLSLEVRNYNSKGALYDLIKTGCARDLPNKISLPVPVSGCHRHHFPQHADLCLI